MIANASESSPRLCVLGVEDVQQCGVESYSVVWWAFLSRRANASGRRPLQTAFAATVGSAVVRVSFLNNFSLTVNTPATVVLETLYRRERSVFTAPRDKLDFGTLRQCVWSRCQATIWKCTLVSTKVSKTDLLTFAWSTMLHHDFVAIALCSDQVATWSIRVSISAANRPIFRLVALSAFGSALWNLRGQLRKWISSANLTRNWEIWWRTKETGSLLSEGANRAWMKTINDRMRRRLTSALYVPMKSSRRLLLVSVKC